MVQIACAAWGFREKSWREYCEMTAAMGISNLEIQAGRGAPCHVLIEATAKEIEQTKKVARETGVRIVAVAGSSDFTSPNPAALEESIRFAQQQIDLTAQLGAEVVRLFTGGLAWESVPALIYTRLQYALNRIGEYAESKGVKVAIENHGGPTANGATIVRMMQGVRSPAVGINYDPANFLKIGVDPLIALRQIITWVNYTHWKDVRWVNGETAYCGVGEGEIRWEPIIAELQRAGYAGYWAIEYEAPEDVERGTRDSLAFLHDLLRQT